MPALYCNAPHNHFTPPHSTLQRLGSQPSGGLTSPASWQTATVTSPSARSSLVDQHSHSLLPGKFVIVLAAYGWLTKPNAGAQISGKEMIREKGKLLGCKGFLLGGTVHRIVCTVYYYYYYLFSSSSA